MAGPTGPWLQPEMANLRYASQAEFPWLTGEWGTAEGLSNPWNPAMAEAAAPEAAVPGWMARLRAAMTPRFANPQGFMGNLKHGLGGGYLGGVGLYTGAHGYNTDTDDYRKRFGLPPSNGETGVMSDLGVRGMGLLTDFGNNVLGGSLSRLWGDDTQGPAQAAIDRILSGGTAEAAEPGAQPLALTAPTGGKGAFHGANITGGAGESRGVQMPKFEMPKAPQYPDRIALPDTAAAAELGAEGEAAKTLGINPEDLKGLTPQERSRALLQVGLQMLTAGGKGENFAEGLGEAASGGMQLYDAFQAKKDRQRESLGKATLDERERRRRHAIDEYNLQNADRGQQVSELDKGFSQDLQAQTMPFNIANIESQIKSRASDDAYKREALKYREQMSSGALGGRGGMKLAPNVQALEQMRLANQYTDIGGGKRLGDLDQKAQVQVIMNHLAEFQHAAGQMNAPQQNFIDLGNGYAAVPD